MKAILYTFVLVLTLLSGCRSKPGQATTPTELTDFGTRYASAWCSQQPYLVAAFFAESGRLTVNNGTPAVGRTAIANVADGFMTAFPDLVVTMDSLTVIPAGADFYWTLTGTNTGPNGTGKKVKINGVEHWQFGSGGLIQQSKGSYDADEYNRQLNVGWVINLISPRFSMLQTGKE